MSQVPGGPHSSGVRHVELETPKGINKRCDLPPEAYRVCGISRPKLFHHANSHLQPDHYVPTPFARRKGYNNTGAPIQVQVNQFFVKSFKNVDIFSFDVRR